MTIFFVTIVKDGFPFVTWHYPMLRSLPDWIDWRWLVVEGTAAPENDTSWCSEIPPGLSTDGTTEYLRRLSAFDPRVIHIPGAWWHGKVNMCNAACRLIDVPGLLWQVDSDEIWTADQILTIVNAFGTSEFGAANCARFFCRYFVGPNLYISNRDCYGNNSYEWNRVWKVKPGVRFKTHEPPVLEDFAEKPITQKQTEEMGCVFDHFAYSTEAQVRFKQTFYGSKNNAKGFLYESAVDGWKRLQAVTKFPVPLKEFFPWVNGDPMVERL